MWTVFIKEIKYYINNPIEVIYLIGLFISIILLIPFGQKAGVLLSQSVSRSILWIALILATQLNSSRLFQRDYESGKLDNYQLAPHRLEFIILAKWAAYLVTTLLPILSCIPLAGLFLNIPNETWPQMALGLASGGLALTGLTSLIAILVIGQGRGAAFLGLILLPLVIPILIFGSDYLANPATFQPSLLFLLGFGFIAIPLLCLIGPSAIKAAN